jgi:hypothetical protein
MFAIYSDCNRVKLCCTFYECHDELFKTVGTLIITSAYFKHSSDRKPPRITSQESKDFL